VRAHNQASKQTVYVYWTLLYEKENIFLSVIQLCKEYLNHHSFIMNKSQKTDLLVNSIEFLSKKFDNCDMVSVTLARIEVLEESNG
jgi:hypothetical protein